MGSVVSRPSCQFSTSDKMIYRALRIIFMVVYGTGTRSFSSSNQGRKTFRTRLDSRLVSP